MGTPIWIQTLKEMKGQEVFYIDTTVGIEYPYIWKNGKKVKLSLAAWKRLYDSYFKDSMNEGYWLMKDIKEEFGGAF